jgi:GntR family transcriptional regulator
MRLWLNRNAEVSLREQQTTQISWGFLSRIGPRRRLPSTRQMARRYGIHAHAASAADRELQPAAHVFRSQGYSVLLTDGNA